MRILSKVMLKRLIRFSITGLGSTTVHVLSAIGLVELLSFDPVIANGIAFCMATVFSLYSNTLWSFSTSVSKQISIRYVVFSVLSAFMSMGIAATAKIMELNYLVGIIMVVLIIPPITFIGHNFWTYKRNSDISI